MAHCSPNGKKRLFSACVSCLPYSAVSQLVPLSSHRITRLLTSTYNTALAAAKKKALFSSETRGVPHVRDHVQPRWPSHSRTNGESILFCIDSSPFMPSWHLDKPTKDSAIWKGYFLCTSARANGKLHESCKFMKALTRIV